MRRTPTWYNNSWEAVAGSLETGAIYLANDKNLYDSAATNAGRWFSIFMLGKKRIIGVMITQDKALTDDPFLLIGGIAEEDWPKSNSEEENKELESTGSALQRRLRRYTTKRRLRTHSKSFTRP